MLSADEFRRVRVRVLKKALLAVGFEAGKSGLYIRRTESGQLHSYSIRLPRWGGPIFSIDLGLHYSAVPMFNESMCVKEPNGYEPQHCWLNTRLRKADNNQAHSVGETALEAEAAILEWTDLALARFAAFEERWSDGRALLAALPPVGLARDAEACKFDVADPNAS